VYTKLSKIIQIIILSSVGTTSIPTSFGKRDSIRSAFNYQYSSGFNATVSYGYLEVCSGDIVQ